MGEAGVEELLGTTIAAAIDKKAVAPNEFTGMIVDTTVQERAVALPTDSRLLEVARAKLEMLAQRAGLVLKQTYEREGKQLRRRAGGYAHGKQYQPEQSGLIVGARIVPGNPYDGLTLAGQVEQTRLLLETVSGHPKPVAVLNDLGYRGVDAEIASTKLIDRGKYKTLSARQRKWLRRRQVVELVIGHVKADHGLRRCWLKGASGDARHVVLCATDFNLRWLQRAIVQMGIKPIELYCLFAARDALHASCQFTSNVESTGRIAVGRIPIKIRFVPAHGRMTYFAGPAP
ncbi:Mobile element protein [Burkholderia singularis]|uniref:Mobile element protein n=1 Tax=Burkholderia singularis TaxID=1503053 RepID=A0A238HBU0_9BURK|nr:Mobile element protein [Burkholderia singularis]